MLERLIRWGFPVLSVVVALAGQVIVPRLIQLQLSEETYTAYIAVTAVAAYIGLAEGGLLMSFLRELSTLHGAGDRGGFAAEIRRARRVFALSATVGGVVALLLIQSALGAANRVWPGAAEPAFRQASLALVVATAVALGCGTYHTAILYSTGRLLLAQVLGLLTGLLPLVALIVALVLTRNLTWGLAVFAASLAVIALARVAHATVVFRHETREAPKGAAPTPLSEVLVAGVALKAAEVLPNAAFPHILAIKAAVEVPTAIPARTVANGCQMVSRMFVNLLQVHITRRIAGDDAQKARGRSEYVLASRFLTSLHLTLLGVVGLTAELLFRLWLPAQAPLVAYVLPGLFAEQALLSAALPSFIPFAAEGRLRILGGVRLTGVLVGLVGLWLMLPIFPRAGYGLSLALAGGPLFVIGCWFELRGFRRLRTPANNIAYRYGAATVAALSSAFYAGQPLAVGGVILLLGLAGLLPTARGIWRMLRTGSG